MIYYKYLKFYFIFCIRIKEDSIFIINFENFFFIWVIKIFINFLVNLVLVFGSGEEVIDKNINFF